MQITCRKQIQTLHTGLNRIGNRTCQPHSDKDCDNDNGQNNENRNHDARFERRHKFRLAGLNTDAPALFAYDWGIAEDFTVSVKFICIEAGFATDHPLMDSRDIRNTSVAFGLVDDVDAVDDI